jgi:hypothetical protein
MLQLHRSLLVSHLRLDAIADSMTEDDFHASVCQLRQSHVWQTDVKLENWFQKKWLPHAQVSFFLCSTFNYSSCFFHILYTCRHQPVVISLFHLSFIYHIDL